LIAFTIRVRLCTDATDGVTGVRAVGRNWDKTAAIARGLPDSATVDHSLRILVRSTISRHSRARVPRG